MTHPVIIPNELILNLVSNSEKKQVKNIDIEITKKIVNKVCPNINVIPNLLKFAQSNQNKIQNKNTNQIEDALAVTNEIYYGTLICPQLSEIYLHGITADQIIGLIKKYDIEFPWTLQYDTLRLGNNKRINRFPLMIVYPKTIEDVQFWVTFVQKYKFSISIRSGGHNYEYFSGENNVILDLSKLLLKNKDKQISINNKNQTVKVAPGVRLGILYHELSKYNFIIAGGICPSVCVGGLIAGGGVGYTLREFGFACDNLLSAKIVLANGQLIKVKNNNEYADLFKAIKGAGQNFGVIVEYKLKTHLLSKIIYFTFTFPITEYTKVMLHWQNLVQKASSKLSGIVVNTLAGLPLFIINGIFLSDNKEKFNDVINLLFINPLKEKNIVPTISSVDVMTYLEAESNIALEIPNMPFYKIRGCYFFKPILMCDWNRILKILKKPLFGDISKGFLAIQFLSYGGNIKNIPENSSVLIGRPSIGFIQMAVYFTNQDDTNYALNYINNVYDIITSFTSKFSEPNASDKSLTNYLCSYYGDNVSFLKLIKRKYDPNNVFHFAQSIPLL